MFMHPSLPFDMHLQVRKSVSVRMSICQYVSTEIRLYQKIEIIVAASIQKFEQEIL